MALRPLEPRRRSEPLIALINIVFLMLVFFLVSATIAPPLSGDVALAQTDALDGRAPPDAAVVLSDGTLMYRGAEITSAEYLILRRSEEGAASALSLRLVPDRDLPAASLLSIAGDLRRAGATEVWIVTERGLR